MDTDGLRTHLELFELDELTSLTAELLATAPEEVCQTKTVGAYARALVAHCELAGTSSALLEAVRWRKPETQPTFSPIGSAPDLALHVGEQLGDYSLEKALGQGSGTSVFLASKDSAHFRVKAYSDECKAASERFLVIHRALAAQPLRGIAQVTAWGRERDTAYSVTPWLGGTLLADYRAAPGSVVASTQRILQNILQALEPLHSRGLAHGNLKASNVLLEHVEGEGAEGLASVTLLDMGGSCFGPGKESALLVRSPDCCAPEVVLGAPSSPAADVYAVGLLAYALLCGRPPFVGAGSSDAERALHTAWATVSESPDPPSQHAAEHVGEHLDRWVLSLLEKSPADRPEDAAAALRSLQQLHERLSQRPPMPASELDELIAALMEDPTSAAAAVALEASIDEGAPRKRVARALELAFARVTDSPETHAAKLNLGFRAGRMFQALEDHESAEAVFQKLVELDPESPLAHRGLEAALIQRGQADAVVERWLEKTERGETAAERSNAWLHIARLYSEHLQDDEQALLAATQAVCESADLEAVGFLERLGPDGEQVWTDVLDTLSAATTRDAAPEQKQKLLGLLGPWYVDKLKRPDIALQCYQALLALAPADEHALSGMAEIYRRAQQWPELIGILARQADAAPSSEAARAHRFEVAELQLVQLNDPVTARHLLERLLEEDPAHQPSNELLGRLLREAGDFAGYASLLERWAEAAEPEERLTLLCRAAGIHEAHLGSATDAMALYGTVISEEPSHMGALRGLDRLYGVLGQYDELLANLQDQLHVAATPRQKLDLYERIAALYEEEFLSPAQAVEAYEAILKLDDKNDGAMVGLERGYERLERWEDLARLLGHHADSVREPERKLSLRRKQARTLDKELGQVPASIAAYEEVLALEADDGEALAAMVRLRQSEGDAAKALEALDRLAEHAPDEAARRESLREAGQLLLERGDLPGATRRWERALELGPRDAHLVQRLLEVYRSLQQNDKAIPLLRAQFELTDAPAARADILAHIAELELAGEPSKARLSAEAALALDAGNALALRILLDLHQQAGALDEAAALAQRLAALADAPPRAEMKAILEPLVAALVASDRPERAAPLLDELQAASPGDVAVAWQVAEIEFLHGASEVAERRIAHVVEHFDGQLSTEQEATAHYRYAESIRRQGDIPRAMPLLEDAMDLDPGSAEPVFSLALCAEAQEDWERAWSLKQQLIGLTPAHEHFDILVSMGELAAGPLEDRSRATQNFVAALELRPDDRKLLSRLMQLYSADKDWAKLVDVVLKLADFQEEPRQKAKYLMTAAMVSSRELQDFDQAITLFAQVTELDPSITKAATERIDLAQELGRYDEAEALLRERAAAARECGDGPTLLKTLLQLADIFATTERVGDELESLAAAREVAPDDRELLGRLTELYRQHGERYMDQAVALQHSILATDPYRTEAYQALRKLYTRTKSADGAWCLCQALYVLNLAEPDEEKFFVRMRSGDPAYAQAVMGSEDWADITHRNADPRLTRVFAIAESAVVNGLGRDLADFGYDPSLELNLARHHFPIGQTLHYAGGVLGIPTPPTFENSNDPGGLASLATRPPTLSIGAGLLTASENAQKLAFLAGRKLTYFRQGFHIRQLTATPETLKTWLFAAIRSSSPSFPVAPDILTDVDQALNVLNQTLSPQGKNELSSLVSELLEDSKALDLKRWVSAVDYTADRAGFLLANDLERSIAVIRSSAEDVATPAPQRTRELVQFAIGPEYIALRDRLGLALK